MRRVVVLEEWWLLQRAGVARDDAREEQWLERPAVTVWNGGPWDGVLVIGHGLASYGLHVLECS